MCGCLLHAPNRGPGPQSSHVPWLGIKPAALWFAGQRSVHWAIPARAPTGFYSQKLWGFIFLALEPWAGWSVLGLWSLLPRYPSWFFFLPHVDVGPPIPHFRAPLHYCTSLHLSTHLHVSTPPTHLDECGFSKSLGVGLPYSSYFWRIWVIFILWSSCNLCSSCVRRWSMFTYTSILIRSPWKRLSLPSLLKYVFTDFFSVLESCSVCLWLAVLFQMRSQYNSNLCNSLHVMSLFSTCTLDFSPDYRSHYFFFFSCQVVIVSN